MYCFSVWMFVLEFFKLRVVCLHFGVSRSEGRTPDVACVSSVSLMDAQYNLPASVVHLFLGVL